MTGARVSPESSLPTVRPGVVRLSCGAWYDPASADDDAPCAWQCECADARPRHLTTEPGAELGDGTGRSGALRGAAARQSLLRGDAFARSVTCRNHPEICSRSSLRPDQCVG